VCSSDLEQEQKLIQATIDLETSQIQKISDQQKLSSSIEQNKLETQLKAIQKKVETEPLGKPKPKPTTKSKLKRFGERASDVFTGLTFGTFVEHLSRPTSLTAEEIKKEARESTRKAIKDTTFVGVGGFGLKGSGKVGVGRSSFLTSLQLQQILSAIKIRDTGVKTTSIQKLQVEEINKIVKNIEKEQSKLTDTSQFLKDVDIFEADVRTAKAISNIGAFPEKISALEKRREGLVKRQKGFEVKQQKFEDVTVSLLKDLRKIGVESKFTKTGEIQFTSKEIEKIVAPVGIKLQKSFLKQDKLTVKNILLGSASITREVGVATGLGLGTGGLGFIARIGSRVAKLPKLLRIGVKTGAIGLVGLGITTTTIKGFKAGEIQGIGKIGAVVGGLGAGGQVAGFGAGGLKGANLRIAKIEKEILSGKTTKTIADIKVGLTTKGKGGLAKQLSKFETKVKGTKFKITSFAELQTRFIKKIGVSNIKILSKVEGKVPRGIPKRVITKGQSLETEDLIRFRLFTKIPKVRGGSKFLKKQGEVKGFLKQDILISKKILDIKAVDLKPSFKPFTKLERVKLLSAIKVVGKPVKVKKIPKDIFTAGERFLFKVSTGKQKVAGFGELAEAKADSLFTSKQFILTTKDLKLGDIKVKGFTTLADTRGKSVDLLKESLKGKLLVLDLKTKQLSMIGIDKKGQLALSRPPKFKVPELEPLKIKTDFKSLVDTKDLLRINLKNIVPKILARQSALIKPTIAETSASAFGLKEILKIQVAQQPKLKLKELSSLKLDLGLKISQLTGQKIIQVPVLKIAQVPKLDLKVILPSIKAPFVTAPPSIIIPVIPALPPILLGKRLKKKKKRAGERPLGELVFSEGFTAKQLGLAPRVLTKAQLRKLLSTSLTGVGIRRAVILK